MHCAVSDSEWSEIIIDSNNRHVERIERNGGESKEDFDSRVAARVAELDAMSECNEAHDIKRTIEVKHGLWLMVECRCYTCMQTWTEAYKFQECNEKRAFEDRFYAPSEEVKVRLAVLAMKEAKGGAK